MLQRLLYGYGRTTSVRACSAARADVIDAHRARQAAVRQRVTYVVHRPMSVVVGQPQPRVDDVLARIHALMGSDTPRSPSLSLDEASWSRDIDRMLDDAITGGRTRLALDVLTQLSSLEEQLQVGITRASHLLRLLNASAFQHDCVTADAVIALAMKRPSTLLEPALVASYAGMAASLPQLDYVRGLTFCAFVLDLNQDAFTPYFNCLSRCHGPAAVSAAVDVIIDTSASNDAGIWSFDALLQAQRALGALPNENAVRLLPALQAAADGAPNRLSASLEGHVDALVRLGWVMDAAHAVLAAGPELELDHALFRVCKALTHRVQTLAREVPRGGASQPVSEALDTMLRVFEVAIARRSAMPGLIERVFSRLIEHGRLDDVERLTSSMLADRELRALLRSDKHCNAVIDALLKADRAPAAEMIFRVRACASAAVRMACTAPFLVQRMLASDAARYPHLAPNVKGFNMFILRAARRGDKAEVRRLMTMMSDRGISADAFTVSAISVLRSPGTVASVTAPTAEARALEEADADALLARIADSNGRLARSSTVAHSTQGSATGVAMAGGTTGPFNQLMQTYFRLGVPSKALGVLDVMHSMRVVPGADTLRTLLVGLALTGGQRMHGVPLDRLPVAWGGVKPDDVYARERASNSDARRRVNDAADAGADQPQLRFAHAATCLARMRCVDVDSKGAVDHADVALRRALSTWQPVPPSVTESLTFDDSLQMTAETDLLPQLPVLLQRMVVMGVLPAQMREAADPVVSWACDLLSPTRALHLFVIMHAAGLWETTLTRMQRATAMFPGLIAFDWLQHGDAAPLLAQDWALLAGSSSTPLSNALRNALQVDSQPRLICKSTAKALLINKHDLRAWMQEAGEVQSLSL